MPIGRFHAFIKANHLSKVAKRSIAECQALLSRLSRRRVGRRKKPEKIKAHKAEKTQRFDWVHAIPAVLMPAVLDDILEAYDEALTLRRNFTNQPIKIFKLLSSAASSTRHAAMECAKELDREVLIQKALAEYQKGGLAKALSYLLAEVDNPEIRSRVLESLAGAIKGQSDASVRALWIAYGTYPRLGKAKKIAKNLLKSGEITNACALLRLALQDSAEAYDAYIARIAPRIAKFVFESSGDITKALSISEIAPQDSANRYVGEIRLAAHILRDGIVIPPRTSIIKKPRQSSRFSVAYVAASALPYQMAGYTVRTHALLTALKDRALNIKCYTRPGYPWDRSILSSRDAALPETVTFDGVDYTCTRVQDVSHQPEHLIDRMSRALEHRFRADMPQVVHAASNHRNALPALIAARRLGVPFLYEMRGLWELTAAAHKRNWEETERFQLGHRLETLVAREADHVCTITQGLADELISCGVDPKKITLLPNAVDPERFQPLAKDLGKAAQLGITSKDFTLVYVGSLTSYEGLDDLIEAIGFLHARGTCAKLLIVGNGAMRGKLESLVIARGLQNAVSFLGVVSHDQARDYLSLADTVALPRKPFKVCEIVSPLKPFEAMAMEKPVVLSDLPVLREIVADGTTGRLCRAGDAADLARVLQELAADPELRVKLGRAARRWVIANRSWNGNAARLKEIYSCLTSG